MSSVCMVSADIYRPLGLLHMVNMVQVLVLQNPHGEWQDKEDFQISVAEDDTSLYLGPFLLVEGSKCMVLLQVIGLVGSSRKRTLMLWQAVELSRMMDRPNLATLHIARKALEPPDDPLEQVCCAVLCCAVPCRAVPCRAVPCRAVPCRAVPCRAVPCRAVPCCAALCCAVLRCTIQFYPVPWQALPCHATSTLRVRLASLGCACASAFQCLAV